MPVEQILRHGFARIHADQALDTDHGKLNHGIRMNPWQLAKCLASTASLIAVDRRDRSVAR
jgi:hypothetical protein